MFSQKHHPIIVGDYTYYEDFEDALNFEKNVKYHYDFLGDKLIIGKFCMIATNSTVTKDVAPYAIVGGNQFNQRSRP